LTLLHCSAALAVTEDGKNANAPLLLASDGILYGTTRDGGQDNKGVVFRINRDGSNYQVLHRFLGGSEGALPEAGLVEGVDGNFYGTTTAGGAGNFGTVFKVTPAGLVTTLYAFTNGSDGRISKARLVRAGNDFIGTTVEGGTGGYGTVFKITPAGALTTLVSFQGTNGAYSYYGLNRFSDGNFYGTTFSAGLGGVGVAFVVTSAGASWTVHTFAGGMSGANPLSGLIEGSDTYKYGTTTRVFENGTSFNRGTIFRLTGDGLQTLYSFSGTGSDGGYPVGDLLQIAYDPVANTSSFIGVTQYGGASDRGTIYRINVPASAGAPVPPITTLHHFGTATGGSPRDGLISGNDGSFYGTTTVAGSMGAGTIYRLNPGTQSMPAAVTVLHNFNTPPPPSNDHFANAQQIAGTNGNVQTTNAGATAETGEPYHAGYQPRRSVWYSWIAPTTGTFIFDTVGSGFNTTLGAYTGTAVNALTLVADDANGPSGCSRIVIRAIAGAEYKIAIGATSEAGGTQPTHLKWRPGAPPPNDDFANAEPISGIAGSVAGTNIDAWTEAGEPNAAEGDASVWYEWTAPASGSVTFVVAGDSPGDTILGAYLGNSFDRLGGVARAVASPVMLVNATAGVTYRIEVDCFRGATSNFVLSWQTSPAQPANAVYEPYVFRTLAGNAPGHLDGTGANARFRRPSSVAVDAAGNRFIADSSNHTIRKVTPAGEVTTFAGTPGQRGSTDGPAAVALFSDPAAIAVDADASVYVADGNHTIRKISAAGQVSTLAGSAGVFGSANGMGSEAYFDSPSGIAVDSTGNVFVADANHAIRKITPAGVVSTVAGLLGRRGREDGAASVARFDAPSGLAIDTSGNLFVADSRNWTIRKITAGGVVSTFAGSAGELGSTDGIGNAARFSIPQGIAVDATGVVFVADTLNHTVRKITPDRAVSTLAGLANNAGSSDGSGSAARFAEPFGVAADTFGNVHVADTRNHLIRSVTSDGVVTTSAGLVSQGSSDGAAQAARFSISRGLVVDSVGYTYVADSSNHTIRKITPDGTTSTLAGTAGVAGSTNGLGSAARFRFPGGLAVDSSGNVFVADTNNHTIRKITPGGAASTLAGVAGSLGNADGTGAAARFHFPGAIAIDSADNLFVADTNNNTIRKVTPLGVVSTFAGSAGVYGYDDGLGNAARFNLPRGVCVDLAGNVFVADTGNATIRKITPEGAVTTWAGLAGSRGSYDAEGTSARFSNPRGITVDGAGSTYVVDSSSNLVRKINSSRVVTTLAGLAGFTGSTDSRGSAARFSAPSGIAAAPGGRLHVADSGNNVIRVGEVALALTSAVSRKVHSSAGTFDIPLASSGTPSVECRGGNHTFVFSFNKQIASGNAAVTSGTGSVSGAPAVSANTLTVNLSGVANAQTLTVTLSNVTDAAGETLPDTTASIRFLLGDSSGNGAVTASDIGATKAAAGQPVTVLNFRNDVTPNGAINASDIGLVKAQSGTSVSGAPSDARIATE
jgi:uncharacterized repeat protein (TIGR03803 family)